MRETLIEIAIILALLIFNGVLAMTEIAVVSARKGRLRQLADQGDARAKCALELAESPNRFLATVQIGITLVGIFAGAFGGITIAEYIDKLLQAWPVVAPYGESIGIAIVVVTITFCSLVLGELVPKRIGLGRPEGIAIVMAKPMHALSRVAAPFVHVLSASTEGLLKLVRFTPSQESSVTEEEVKGLMEEGLKSGSFNEVESEIVRSALELDELTVRDIMTPRIKITFLNCDDPHMTVWQKIVLSDHSCFPVYRENRDNVVGIVSVKAIYANLAAGVPAKILDLMTEPLVVPAMQTAIQLMATFRNSGKNMALVADEFGGIVGLVTVTDIFQAVLGDFPTLEERMRPTIRQREDGSWILDATVDIEELERALPEFSVDVEEEKDFQTLAGFVAKRLGHVPSEGETFVWGDLQFEVLDMDRHRVDKVMVTRANINKPSFNDADMPHVDV